MKSADLRKYHQLNSKNLILEIQKQEAVLQQSRLDKVTGKLKNLHLPSTNRHDIARLKTLVRLKQLTSETQPTPQPVKTLKTKPTSKKITEKKSKKATEPKI